MSTQLSHNLMEKTVRGRSAVPKENDAQKKFVQDWRKK